MKSFILVKLDPFFVLPGFRFAGAKFSHVIASARLSGMKHNIAHAYKRKLKENVNKFKQIPSEKLSHLPGMKSGRVEILSEQAGIM